jgi:predicted NBD/HSP70 family sugar kinase
MFAALLKMKEHVQATLDPDFQPAVLVHRAYQAAAKAAGGERLFLALERDDGVCRADTELLPFGSAADFQSIQYLNRWLKNLLWLGGGRKLHVCGPLPWVQTIQRWLTPDGALAYEVKRMGIVYGGPFEVIVAPSPADMPAAREEDLQWGGHWDGCRLGFDLGASSCKTAAVIDGRTVFTTAHFWNAHAEPNPEYHYAKINEFLREAAMHLPRVDAVGGSAAGAWIRNEVKISSLFWAVPPEAFARQVQPFVTRLENQWRVPFAVLNDGEVTALAGALALNAGALYGLAMGSSIAGGWVKARGCFSGRYNETAYAPLDFNPQASRDPQSGDYGVGATYLSQQAVVRLALKAGFSLPRHAPAAERALLIHEAAERAEPQALRVFETIGVYLGYALALYADFFDFNTLWVLGRSTSGRGGEALFSMAEEVVKREFPELAEKIKIRFPDEKSRGLGQAVAAASLPKIASATSAKLSSAGL